MFNVFEGCAAVRYVIESVCRIACFGVPECCGHGGAVHSAAAVQVEPQPALQSVRLAPQPLANLTARYRHSPLMEIMFVEAVHKLIQS